MVIVAVIVNGNRSGNSTVTVSANCNQHSTNMFTQSPEQHRKRTSVRLSYAFCAIIVLARSPMDASIGQ